MSTTAQRGTDVVSLDERLLYLRVLRAVIAGATVLDAALLPGALRQPFTVIGSFALAYLVVCLIAEAVWRLMKRRGLWLFGSLLILDGIYLAWASYLTGGSTGPLRYLILVHLGAVTLLASYRTGVKLALWHSLLQLCVFYAMRAGLLDGGPKDVTVEWYRIIAFIVALWALTLTTASLAAVNERELRRRRFELEQLAQMGRDLEDANDPLSAGDVLLEALTDTFGFRRMALFEVVDDSPRMLTARGLLDAVVADFGLGDKSVLRVVNERRETLLVAEIDETVDPWLAAIMPD